MKPLRSYYLLRLQYLGFRFSGWQKQPERKTVEGMLAKTLKFILPSRNFKILGSGRTDAKVSALDMGVEIFLEGDPLEDLVAFNKLLNFNLPSDIRALSVEQVDKSFNIIKSVKTKEYVYLFSFGQKNHPFCAPFMANILEDLKIDRMIEGAKIFEGTHYFDVYTARLQKSTNTLRKVISCEICENNMFEANFFPSSSYTLIIKGKGFMRYQIRMMMGALIQLGKGELSLNDIKRSLQRNSNQKLTYVAPGSGLILHAVEFGQETEDEGL
ncbi:tRNA pseudouridine synthase A [Pareuzebyella sediminis]|uniref:tRNA pseudouridine synthase A n=1 Tax=Pareuzebyella sediminis TaxID=2607998 RepID=UPI0011ECE930|nr:tRNA pseudouridine(38-40) synthase TruA [Pareuzebyella sediminis]